MSAAPPSVRPSGPRLVADIGGTNARFALVSGDGSLPAPMRTAVAAHAEFEGALRWFLEAAGASAEPPAEALIAAAGPVRGGAVTLTNAPWTIEAGRVSGALDGAPVRLLNDLEAVALCLPHLDGEGLVALRPGTAEAGAPRLAVNVGTGFGGALAVPTPAGWTAVAAEPGHMVFAGATEAERALAAFVRTVEDVLSGRGLAALHQRLSGYVIPVAPEEVMAAAARGEATATATLELATGLLARVSADLVLATGAWGGLALTGSVVDALAAHDPQAFSAALEAAFGRDCPVADRLSAVPAGRIAHPFPALLGLARA